MPSLVCHLFLAGTLSEAQACALWRAAIDAGWRARRTGDPVRALLACRLPQGPLRLDIPTSDDTILDDGLKECLDDLAVPYIWHTPADGTYHAADFVHNPLDPCSMKMLWLAPDATPIMEDQHIEDPQICMQLRALVCLRAHITTSPFTIGNSAHARLHNTAPVAPHPDDFLPSTQEADGEALDDIHDDAPLLRFTGRLSGAQLRALVQALAPLSHAVRQHIGTDPSGAFLALYRDHAGRLDLPLDTEHAAGQALGQALQALGTASGVLHPATSRCGRTLHLYLPGCNRPEILHLSSNSGCLIPIHVLDDPHALAHHLHLAGTAKEIHTAPFMPESGPL